MSAPWTYNAGECENCGHYDMEGDLKEGVCKDCREAYPEDYADLDADEHPDCRLCQGTGIGQHGDPDTSKCHVCKGRGYLLPSREDA
ncbi:MAG TPA: hypothetical protein VFP15_13485 [Gemmatimonadaceae bacterium]|nr:hypothetical protein [Gemmatimonadaceae bacterium]